MAGDELLEIPVVHLAPKFRVGNRNLIAIINARLLANDIIVPQEKEQ